MSETEGLVLLHRHVGSRTDGHPDVTPEDGGGALRPLCTQNRNRGRKDPFVEGDPVPSRLVTFARRHLSLTTHG